MKRSGAWNLRRLVLAFVGLFCQIHLAAAGLGQWIVVTPRTNRPALTALIEHRQAEGFKVVVLEFPTPGDETGRDGLALERELKELSGGYAGRTAVLLAGIASGSGPTNPEAGAVPASRGVTGRMRGQWTDYIYSLPESDGAPRVAVGRFPARTVEELQGMVRKTLEFESPQAPAPWRNRLSLLAGNPGGGMLSEMFVQRSLGPHLAALHPSWELGMVFDLPGSPCYVPPSRLTQTSINLLEQGQLFAFYFGHSDAAGLWSGRTFLTRNDWEKLSIAAGRGPLFTCGCWACQTSGIRGDGYGLAAIRNPSGPVAVIGATAESYGAAGWLAGEGLLGCLAAPPFPSRLADYWMAAQTGLARGKMDETTFKLMDMADGTGGRVPLKTQRLEHLEMWTLLGDPALRMPVVTCDVRLMAMENARPGDPLEIRGVLPKRLENADIRISLERPLDSTPPSLEKLPPDSPENRKARNRAILANHARANSYVLGTVETKATGNKFGASLKVPTALPSSTLVLRATARRGVESGMGVALALVQDSDVAK